MFIDSIADKITDFENQINQSLGSISSSENQDPNATVYPDSALLGYMDTFILDIYNVVNRSILKGEYVCHQNFEDKLSSSIEQIKQLSVQMSDLSPVFSLLLFELFECLKNDLSNYRFFVHIFKNTITQPELHYFDHDVKRDFESKSIFGYLPSLKAVSRLFYLNIILANLDLEFELDEETLRYLLSILHKLDVLESETSKSYIIAALKHKCKLLIFKFNYKKDTSRIRVIYSYYDNSEQALDLSNILTCTEGLLPKLKGLSPLNKRDFEYYLTDQHKQIIKNDNESFYAYYIQCKYFRYILKSELLLNRLIRSFNELKFDNEFDENNASFCVNYLENCKLKLFLETNVYDSQLVSDRLDEMHSVQIRTGVENYYPYLIVAEWYGRYLESKIKDIDSDLSFDFERFELCLEKASSSLQRCKDNAGCFMPFRPNYEDCLEHFNAKDEIISIFIRTSYTIPVEYKDEELRIEKLKSEYSKFSAIIKARESISFVVEGLKNENLGLKTKFDDYKKKNKDDRDKLEDKVAEDLKEFQRGSVQILAIFATIVLFASGSIQIMTKTTSVRDASIFLLLFALCIGLISTSVWFIMSKNIEEHKIKRRFVGLLIISLIGINAFVIFGEYGMSKVGDEKIKENAQTKNKNDQELTSDIIMEGDSIKSSEV